MEIPMVMIPAVALFAVIWVLILTGAGTNPYINREDLEQADEHSGTRRAA
jgi:hypothetical protein